MKVSIRTALPLKTAPARTKRCWRDRGFFVPSTRQAALDRDARTSGTRHRPRARTRGRVASIPRRRAAQDQPLASAVPPSRA